MKRIWHIVYKYNFIVIIRIQPCKNMFTHISMNKLDATTIKNITNTLKQELFKVVYLLTLLREIDECKITLLS